MWVQLNLAQVREWEQRGFVPTWRGAASVTSCRPCPDTKQPCLGLGSLPKLFSLGWRVLRGDLLCGGDLSAGDSRTALSP